MPQILHPAFIHQVNDMIYVCDGRAEAAFETAEAFRAAEPDFALPDGVAALNYERRGDDLLFMLTAADGSVRMGDAEGTDAALAAACEGYIDNVAVYAAGLAERDHPLYGITDLAEARRAAKEMAAGEFERRAAAVAAGYGAVERSTWERQLEEARAVSADASAAAPLLEAIAVAGETTADVAAKVMAKAQAMTLAAAPLMKIKRTLFDAIDGASLAALAGYDAAAAWEAAAG